MQPELSPPVLIGRDAPVLPASPGNDVVEARLSVAAAARRLGIAPSTLRTWDRRYGIGPSEHTPGRHRRYSQDDLARLELMQRALVRGASPADAAGYALSAQREGTGAEAPRTDPLDGSGGGPAEPVDPLGPEANGDESRVRVGGRVLRLPGAGRTARGLGRAVLALDAPAVHGLLETSIGAVGVEAAWDDVVRPVLAAVGERWAHDGAGIEVEHLVSECIRHAFGARAAALRPVADARPVLLAAMPAERHTLPLVALSAALAERGVACRLLGADVPPGALVAAIRRVAPVAVVLWAQVGGTADVDVLLSLPRTRPRFRAYAAGPGWDGAVLSERIDRLTSLGAATSMISDAVLV